MAKIYQEKLEALPPLSKKEPKKQRTLAESSYLSQNISRNISQVERPILQMALVGV